MDENMIGVNGPEEERKKPPGLAFHALLPCKVAPLVLPTASFPALQRTAAAFDFCDKVKEFLSHSEDVTKLGKRQRRIYKGIRKDLLHSRSSKGHAAKRGVTQLLWPPSPYTRTFN